jgi:tetratricopeptide (TPR) repeat protein
MIVMLDDRAAGSFEARLERTRLEVLAGQWSDALPVLGDLIREQPECQLAHALLSRCLLRLNQPGKARRQALYGLAWGPHVECLVALEEACAAERDFIGAELALAALRKLMPGDAYVALRLGNNRYEVGDLETALAYYAESAALNPAISAPHMNRGFIQKTLGYYGEALSSYRHALSLEPEDADVHWNLSQLLLLIGQYEEGLREAEWRWKKANFPSKPRGFSQPLWMGEVVDALLVHGEQGFGDCLQMLRYVPFAARRVRRVVLEIQPELYRLVLAQVSQEGSPRLLPSNVDVVIQGKLPLPPFDAQVPMMTLPLSLGMTDLGHPPTRRAYLECPLGIRFNDEGKSDRLLNVGFVWRGRPTYPHDHLRSFGLADMMPLFSVKGIRWFSLQKTPDTDVGQELQSAGLPYPDLGANARDFYDTASFLRSLDLLISTDTSVAHLSAALGVETWVGLMKIPDWRWGLEGERSAWYDSIRLFRQEKSREWGAVFKAMRNALTEKVNTMLCGATNSLNRAAERSQYGLQLRGRGLLEEASQCQLEAFDLAPTNWGIRVNLAVSLQDVGKLDEAIDHFAEAVSLSGAPIAKTNLAMAQLRAGKLDEGFRGFLWRWEVPQWPQKPYTLPFPHLLDAEKVLSQPVVLVPDQGYGDTLMTLPWMRWILERNPRATVVVKQPLLTLVKMALGDVCEHIGTSAQGRFAGWLTGFDLPAVFPDALTDYLRQRAAIESRLRVGFATLDVTTNTYLKDSEQQLVGIVWRSNLDQELDAWRSIPVQVVSDALVKSAGQMSWLALFPDVSKEEFQHFKAARVDLHLPFIEDFRDTARHMLACRGVLTVDTAMAHLAGLLGIPTVVLVNALGDWRWGNRGSQSFWYPSISIERQPSLGDWRQTIAAAIEIVGP